MERLWLQSPLAASRPDQKKLKRVDYLRRTIHNACQRCDTVYTGSTASNQLVAERLADNATHHDIALAFAQSVRGKLLYDTDSGVWYEYDGTRWKKLQPGAAAHQIRLFCDRNTRAELKRTRSQNFVSSVEKFVMADPAIARQAADFDRDNYLLNTPSGTFNLLKGKQQSHDPNDLITMITVASPSTGPESIWERFVLEVCSDDADLAKTLQMLLGSSLSCTILTRCGHGPEVPSQLRLIDGPTRCSAQALSASSRMASDTSTRHCTRRHRGWFRIAVDEDTLLSVRNNAVR